jgi:hypothetical protein
MPTERGEEGERVKGRKILGYDFDSLLLGLQAFTFTITFTSLSPGTAGPGRPVGGRFCRLLSRLGREGQPPGRRRCELLHLAVFVWNESRLSLLGRKG